MNIYLLEAKETLIGETKASGLKTSTIRSVSAKIYRKIKNESVNTILGYCEDFLNDRSWEMGVIAFDWAFRLKSQYTIDLFDTFELWLKKYVRGWGDCDDFCTHAVGELLCQFPELFLRIIPWTKHQDFWVRRAAAVTLIPALFTDKYFSFDPFIISDALLCDEHDLVLKGYGWMLKIYSLKEQQKVLDYLKRNAKNMSRVAFRYALEKMPANIKKELMNL